MKDRIKLFDIVRLRTVKRANAHIADTPSIIPAGTTGTVLHIYPSGQAFDVDFVREDGSTIEVFTVERSEVELVPDSELRRNN